MAGGDVPVPPWQQGPDPETAKRLLADLPSRFQGIFGTGGSEQAPQRQGGERQTGQHTQVHIDTDQIGQEIQGHANRLFKRAQGLVKEANGGRDVTAEDAARLAAKAAGLDVDNMTPEEIAIAAAKYTLGGGIPGVAVDQFVKHGGGKKVMDIFNRGNRELTKVDTNGFVKAFSDPEVKAQIDPDRDGFVTEGGAKGAKDDLVFRVQNAHFLDVLQRKNSVLASLSNDEWFREKSGVSQRDVDALAYARKHGTGFASMKEASWQTTKDMTYPILGSTALATIFSYAKFGLGAKGRILGTAIGVGLAGLAVSGIYGAGDYQLFRKDKIEEMLKELG